MNIVKLYGVIVNSISLKTKCCNNDIIKKYALNCYFCFDVHFIYSFLFCIERILHNIQINTGHTSVWLVRADIKSSPENWK